MAVTQNVSVGKLISDTSCSPESVSVLLEKIVQRGENLWSLRDSLFSFAFDLTGRSRVVACGPEMYQTVCLQSECISHEPL